VETVSWSPQGKVPTFGVLVSGRGEGKGKGRERRRDVLIEAAGRGVVEVEVGRGESGECGQREGLCGLHVDEEKRLSWACRIIKGAE